ncbi:TauD/TfdA dioxygenase family protein [Sphaerimonospora sp. CA-214678]|uniref:TauD/TfdA dioxygenase family protein n=1 Tax=Sphaerimonospora sp. CA-214678 TaxID=3240029 RepID=UPI003D94CDE7
MTLRVTPLVEKTFGAVIDGVDVRSLDETTWHGIESAFLEHEVIVLKGQSLGVEKQTAFARRFGELELRSDQTMNPDLEGRPIVFGISNIDADGNRIKDRDHPQTRYVSHPLRPADVMAADTERSS